MVEIGAVSADVPTVTLDASDLLVAPGFVDLQLNGLHGIHLTDEPERVAEVAEVLVRFGVTSFLPTVVSSAASVTDRALAVDLAAMTRVGSGAEPLGWHFEGPMLNPARSGAHRREHLRAPTPSLINRWSASRGLALVTMAPELPGALEVIEALVGRGVVVSAGHTAATVAELRQGLDAGVTMLTHLWNAMTPLGHREPGPVGAALAGEVVAGLIADGIHIDPMVVALTWRAMGADRLVLVSDAVAPLGLVPDEAVHLADGTLAGSTLTLDQAVRNVVAWAGAPIEQAVRAATETPARIIGRPAKGVLRVGADADLVLLDDSLAVVATVVRGRVVHLTEADRLG